MNHKIYTIDRITEGIAVCFDDENNRLELSLEHLYPEAKESDVFIQTKDGYVLDAKETAKRKQQNLNLYKRIIRKGDAD